MPPLRVCVSGQQGGPDLCPVLELLGREEVVHRIERAIEKFFIILGLVLNSMSWSLEAHKHKIFKIFFPWLHL